MVTFFPIRKKTTNFMLFFPTNFIGLFLTSQVRNCVYWLSFAVVVVADWIFLLNSFWENHPPLPPVLMTDRPLPTTLISFIFHWLEQIFEVKILRFIFCLLVWRKKKRRNQRRSLSLYSVLTFQLERIYCAARENAALKLF